MAVKQDEIKRHLQGNIELLTYYVNSLEHYSKIDEPDDERIADILADIDRATGYVKALIERYKEAKNA